NRFFKGLASWIGFRQLRVDYEPAARGHGRSTWNLYSLLGLSIEGLTSFSVAPLRLASMLGLLLAGAAFVFGNQILVETFFFGKSVPGYPSVVVGLMVLGGVQLIMIGIMGEYIGKILSELKARPVYFVAEHQLKSAEGTDRTADEPPARSAAECPPSGSARMTTAFRHRSMPRSAILSCADASTPPRSWWWPRASIAAKRLPCRRSMPRHNM